MGFPKTHAAVVFLFHPLVMMVKLKIHIVDTNFGPPVCDNWGITRMVFGPPVYDVFGDPWSIKATSHTSLVYKQFTKKEKSLLLKKRIRFCCPLVLRPTSCMYVSLPPPF